MQSWWLSALRKMNTTLCMDQIKWAEKIAKLPRKKKKSVLSCSLGKPGVAQAGHMKKIIKKIKPHLKLIEKSYMREKRVTSWPKPDQSVGCLLQQSWWQHWLGCVQNIDFTSLMYWDRLTQTARAHRDMRSVSKSLFLPLYRQPALTHPIWGQHRKCLNLLCFVFLVKTDWKLPAFI